MPMTSVRVVTSRRSSPRRIVGYGTTGRSISAQATAASVPDRPDGSAERDGGEGAPPVQHDRHRGPDVRDQADPSEHRGQRAEPDADEPGHPVADDAPDRREHET